MNFIFPGLIDLHVQSAPDLRPRRHTDLELAAEARRAGARAVVIKSHHVPTMDRAWHTSRATPGLAVFGGLALNWGVGGLNPHATAAALGQGAKIVWLPTLHSGPHRRREGRDDGIAVTRDGRVVDAALQIFEQVAEADAILATGHLGADEIPLVVAAASARRVRKIVVTHPEHDVVGMSLDQQRALAREFPVFFERCYSQPDGHGGYTSNFAANLRAIEVLGFSTTVLSTDAGQIENPSWTECWDRTVQAYRAAGVTEVALQAMCSTHAAGLLKLEG